MTEAGTNSSGITTRSNGTFSSVTPPAVKLAEVQRARCFQTGPYSVGDRGLLHGDGAAEAMPTTSPSLATWVTTTRPRGRVMRGFACRARRRDFLTISKSARRWAKSSIASSAIPACRLRPRDLRRSRAPGRYCRAARTAHRSPLRIGAEPAGAGGTRASRRSSAGLRLLYRPPGAGAKKGLSLGPQRRGNAADSSRVD